MYVFIQLWFDVGIKRYTTIITLADGRKRCGLMQESKDIQPINNRTKEEKSCGLMQESKDIQRTRPKIGKYRVVV